MADERPCVKCGCTERYSSGGCKACAIARGKAQYAKNPKKANAYAARYRAENADRIKARDAVYRENNRARRKSDKAAWHAANAQKAKEYRVAWIAAHPDADRIRSHNRRARVKKNGGLLSNGLGKKLFALQKGRCACCKRPLGNGYHMDHIMPLALGGTNTDDNIQLLRQRCNNQKHATHPVDFMRGRGFLL